MMILEMQLVDFHSTQDHNIIKKIICLFIYFWKKGFNFFWREFQPMSFAPNNSSLLSYQDTGRFFV